MKNFKQQWQHCEAEANSSDGVTSKAPLRMWCLETREKVEKEMTKVNDLTQSYKHRNTLSWVNTNMLSH